MVAMYSRQCGSETAAKKEMAAIREEGRRCFGPVKKLGPNGRTEVWEYSAATEPVYEVTFIDSGKTVKLTKSECEERFGKDEFMEIAQGFLPHIVAVTC